MKEHNDAMKLARGKPAHQRTEAETRLMRYEEAWGTPAHLRTDAEVSPSHALL